MAASRSLVSDLPSSPSPLGAVRNKLVVTGTRWIVQTRVLVGGLWRTQFDLQEIYQQSRRSKILKLDLLGEA
jgi:hypothetical protein